MQPILEQAEKSRKTLFLTIESQKEQIEIAYKKLKEAIKDNKKILVCGNGGSAAEAQHFASEITVRFKKNRKAYPAIALSTDTSAITACANDFSFDDVFSRQVEALANKGDVLFALSTSGNSKNIVKAAQEAKRKGCIVISLTGIKPSNLESFSDVTIKAQGEETARIQETQLFLIHIFSDYIEDLI